MKKENIYLVEMVYEKERKSDLLQMGVSSHEAEIVRKEKRIKKATGKKKQKQTETDHLCPHQTLNAIHGFRIVFQSVS